MKWRFTLNPDTDAKVIADPIGWNDIEFSLNRDVKWHGIFFEYSLPLEFFNDPDDPDKDAYTYLQAEYDSAGVDGSVILKVELACDDDAEYDQEGLWKLDFITYKESRSEICTIQLQLQPENCLMTFRNRYNLPVNLEQTESVDGTELDDYTYLGQEVNIPPVKLLQIATLNSPTGGSAQVFNDVTQTDVITSGGGPQYENFIFYAQYGMLPGHGLSFDEPNDLDEIDARVDLENLLTTDFTDMDSLYTFTYAGEYTVTVTLTGRIEIDLDSDGAKNTDCSDLEDTFSEYEVKVILLVGGVEYVLYTTSGSACYTTGLVITSLPVAAVTNTITVTAGQQMKLYVRTEASGNWDKLIGSADMLWTGKFTGYAAMEISALTEYEASPHKMYLINEAGSRILESITDDCIRMYSSYYGRTDSEPYESPDGVDGPGSLRGITLGLLLRNYETRKQLTHSFQEFFEALNAIDNIGIGLEEDTERGYSGYEVMRVEPMEYFYTDDIVLTHDNVALVEISPMTDYMANRVHIGYSKYAMEEYYGLDEFNTERKYQTRTKAIDSEYRRICEWIASGLAVEITRRKVPGSLDTLEDWQWDNDTFIICLQRSGYALAVEQGNISGPSGFIDPDTVMNYRISPARNMIRHLKTGLMVYRQPEAFFSRIKYVDGTGNILASGYMTGDDPVESGSIDENQSLSNIHAINDSGLPIFVPEIWKYEYPMTLAEYQDLKLDKTGIIRATFGSDLVYKQFYLHKVTYRPNDGMATFELIPKKLYAIDECCVYILRTQGDGTTNVGSTIFTGAELQNMFFFVDGEAQKYNDANTANNDIFTWDDTTGYAVLNSPTRSGSDILILYIPDMAKNCNPCIRHYEGRGNGTDTIVLTGLEDAPLSSIFILYNGNLLKYNDSDPANNEISSWTAASATLVVNGTLKSGREVRAWAFINCGS